MAKTTFIEIEGRHVIARLVSFKVRAKHLDFSTAAQAKDYVEGRVQKLEGLGKRVVSRSSNSYQVYH